jgi:hypothetical protein
VRWSRAWLIYCRKAEGPKRQRTASASPSSSRDQRRLTSQAADSDEGPTVRNGGAKKIRGAAARNHREKELREEREKSRAEAQKKRQGRAERRRVGPSYSLPSYIDSYLHPHRIGTSRRSNARTAVLNEEDHRSTTSTSRTILLPSRNP